MANVLSRIFGSRNQRLVGQYAATVRRINALEPELSALADAELAARSDKLRGELAAGRSLDDILPEAFAVVREASRRTLGLRHFDVQLIGGMVLHHGKIAEMRTGEGKTLVATLPAYLNSLTGLGVHIVTVNDYLAQRDAEWMGRIYRFLGLTVGVNLAGLPGISVPTGLSSAGLPIGLQVVAPALREDTVLRVAATWEAMSGFAGRTAPLDGVEIVKEHD